MKYFLTVVALSGYLEKRYRIGGVTYKTLLIQIDSCPRNRTTDVYACQVVFYQCATYFFVLPVNIVGPLDADSVGVLR